MPPGGAAPYDYLLRNTVNELCLTCHDGSFGPDVLATNAGAALTTGRQAGALNRDNVAPYFDATGHTLGATDVAPGGTWAPDATHGLECTNCHQPHGYGGPTPNPYRNLYYGAGGVPFSPSVTYATGTNVLTADVFQRTAVTHAPDHYDIANIDFNEPDQTKSGYGAWCGKCHTNFHGDATNTEMRNQAGPAGQQWLRHPTADADIGAVGGGHSSSAEFDSTTYRVQVMSGTGNWGTQGFTFPSDPGNLTPSCFSCHRSHGNANAFGLIYPSTVTPATIGENGPGTNAKELCKQCHVQG